LAEGVFASAGTCHAQWERAAESRDDKLVDFWQRARDRAWAVGCQTFTEVQSRQSVSCAEAQSIVRGVRMGLCAQEILFKSHDYPLSSAEGNLRVLLADTLVTCGRHDMNLSWHQELLNRAAKHALGLISSLHPCVTQYLPQSLPVVTVSEHACAVLSWVSQKLCTLHVLTRTLATDPDVFAACSDSPSSWWRCVPHITSVLTDLEKGINGYDQRLIAQQMFVADLAEKVLLAEYQHRPAHAFWLRLLAEILESFLPEGLRYKGPGEQLLAAAALLRLGLADALEQEVKKLYPEVAQWLEGSWPQERRGFPLVFVSCALQAEAIASIVTSYHEFQRWKQQAAATADPVARCHLEGGAGLYLQLQ
jgi:hypothetical protein